MNRAPGVVSALSSTLRGSGFTERNLGGSAPITVSPKGRW